MIMRNFQIIAFTVILFNSHNITYFIQYNGAVFPKSVQVYTAMYLIQFAVIYTILCVFMCITLHGIPLSFKINSFVVPKKLFIRCRKPFHLTSTINCFESKNLSILPYFLLIGLGLCLSLCWQSHRLKGICKSEFLR